jgi:hypothetical protein
MQQWLQHSGLESSYMPYLAGFVAQSAAVWSVALVAQCRIKVGTKDLRAEDLRSLVLNQRG